MNNSCRQIIHFIWVILIFASATLSAGSKIYGVVKDAKSGDPLVGANVFVDGTSFGASSDQDGVYFILDVPAGQYNLKCVYIGYKSVDIPITVSDDANTQQDITLVYQVVAGEVVTVLAQAEGQIAAINQQLSSNTIKNVVSAARIRELPDANATESVGRLPGVSIVRSGGEGREVVIRGLSSENNLVTINGVRMPGTEFNNRGHSLSMISSGILEGIELTKAATPDKDADAIGGTVNFKLRKAPNGFRKNLRVQGAYHSQISDVGTFKADGGLSNRFFNKNLGMLALFNYENVDRSNDQLRASYTNEDRLLRDDEEFLPAFTTNASIADREETRERIGGTFLLDYQFSNNSITFTNFASQEERDILIRNTSYDLGGNTLRRSVDQPVQTIYSLQNSLYGEHNLSFGQIEWTLAHALSRREHPATQQWTFVEGSPFTVPVSTVERENPENIHRFLKNDTLNTKLDRGVFSEEKQQQRDLTAQLDIALPFTVSKKISAIFKFGGKFLNQDRFYDNRGGNLNFRNGAGLSVINNYSDEWIRSGLQVSMLNFLDNVYNPGNILDGSFRMGASPDIEIIRRIGADIESEYIFPAWDNRNDYENEANITAGYAMAELSIGSRLFFMPGVRYEHEDIDYTARAAEDRGNNQSSIEDTTANRSLGLWFPMVHLRYKVTDWFDIRLARTRTISRPSFQQISPRFANNIQNLQLSLGNPALKPMLSTNYDLFFSFYSNKVGLITIGGFYKEIQDMIYNLSFTTFEPEVEGLDSRFINYRISKPFNNDFDGTVKGIELDFQTHFWYLPAPFDGLILQANLARINSETKYYRSFVRQEPINVFPFSRSVRVDTSRQGRLLNQADYIANVSLGYDLGGFSARISANYQGNTLSSINRTFPNLDGFTADRLQWDFAVSQKVLKGMNFYGHLANFSNRPDQAFIRFQNFATSLAYYGMTGDIGIRYNF